MYRTDFGDRRHLPIVITSDNDPYCPEGLDGYKAIYTDALGLTHYIVGGGGHISIDDGYGPWPALLDWCLDGKAAWRQPATSGPAPKQPT